jgi:hypothetical protein
MGRAIKDVWMAGQIPWSMEFTCIFHVNLYHGEKKKFLSCFVTHHGD